MENLSIIMRNEWKIRKSFISVAFRNLQNPIHVATVKTTLISALRLGIWLDNDQRLPCAVEVILNGV